MSKGDSDAEESAKLRRRAENSARKSKSEDHADIDSTRLVHELKVHQIELEMQNEELRRAKDEAEMLRDKYADLYDFAPIAYLSFDSTGIIRELNLTAAKLVGEPRKSLLGRSFSLYVAPEYMSTFKSFCRHLQSSEISETCEIEIVRAPKQRISVELVGRSCTEASSQDKLVRTAVFDVTLRNRLVRENQRLTQSARTAQETAEKATRAKDEFIALVSHELRTPLTPVMGWVRMLESGKLKEPDRKQAFAIIDRCIKSQVRLVEDLLDISRITAGKLTIQLEPADLREIARRVIERERSTAAEKGIDLQYSEIESPCPIQADPERIQQVIGNIVGNALKFTPSGGVIALTFKQSGTNVVLEIKDTGIGISAEALPFIFERFRQGSAVITKKYRGMGLGLNIASHLVKAHGGRLEASSPGENRGATFQLSLPLASHLLKAPGAVRRDVSDEKDGLRGARILVVEDDPGTLDLLTAVLQMGGAEVVPASNADDALRAFALSLPDVILSDIGLPGKNGIDLLREIRADRYGATVPAIALSAYAQQEIKNEALAAGFQAFLSKPVEMTELTEALTTALSVSTK